MNKLITTLFGLISSLALAQEVSLSEVIEMAQKQSTQSRINTANYVASTYNYDIYYKGMLPSVGLSATLPNLNRSLDKITLPDGTDDFVQRSQMFSNAGLTINQPLIWTGGNVYFNPSIQRIDIFGNNPSTTYLGNPVSFGLSQPIFGFNPYKWSRKTEPLRLQVAEQKRVENKEDVSIQTVRFYFNWLTATMQYELSQIFQRHNDTIFQISKGRYEMGKIAENDLLQAELNALTSNINLQQSEFELQLATMKMEQFLNDDLGGATPVIDTGVTSIEISFEQALHLARENMSDFDNYEVQLLDAEREIAQQRANTRPTFSVFGTYGLTQSGQKPEDVITNTQDRQLLVVQLDVPLYQFGLNRTRTDLAQLNREILSDQLSLNQRALEQLVFERVGNFIRLQNQVEIARRADFVANKGYEVTRQRFMIGKIDMLELNNAITRKTQARMDYVSTLRDYWAAYYEIRKLCHFDFRTNQPITIE
ncbi:MAG: TolC family protein [Flavobacteriales bacterium]